MSIKATVGGTAYNGIATINAGGKSIALTEVGTITTPTETKNITANGTNIDVLNYAKVNVSVPSSSDGITPTGTKEITSNGTYDVTSFAQALVNVASASGNVRIERGSCVAEQDSYRLVIKQNVEKVPIMVFVMLDESSVDTYIGGYSYGIICLKDSFTANIKSASSSWYGTSCSCNDGTNTIRIESNNLVVTSALKLYGGTYNWIAVYED